MCLHCIATGKLTAEELEKSLQAFAQSYRRVMKETAPSFPLPELSELQALSPGMRCMVGFAAWQGSDVSKTLGVAAAQISMVDMALHLPLSAEERLEAVQQILRLSAKEIKALHEVREALREMASPSKMSAFSNPSRDCPSSN